MKVRGNLPPGHDSLLFSISGKRSFIMSSPTDKAGHAKAFHLPNHGPLSGGKSKLSVNYPYIGLCIQDHNFIEHSGKVCKWNLPGTHISFNACVHSPPFTDVSPRLCPKQRCLSEKPCLFGKEPADSGCPTCQCALHPCQVCYQHLPWGVAVNHLHCLKLYSSLVSKSLVFPFPCCHYSSYSFPVSSPSSPPFLYKFLFSPLLCSHSSPYFVPRPYHSYGS